MKVENYTGTADTFTFPHNPRTFTPALERFIDKRTFPYSFGYYGLTAPVKSRQSINLVGHFDGSTKESDYRSLAKHVNENKLKKLYFGTDKFYICLGLSISRTHSGGRTNFIDYVANFESPFGILFGDTQRSGSNTSSEDNEGNVPTPIEKITGTVSSGSPVTIKDGDGNGFTFTPSASGTVTINLIELLDVGSDNFFTDYLVAKISTTRQILASATAGKSMFLFLDPAETLNTLFTGGTVSGITSPTFFFRDGWSGD